MGTKDNLLLIFECCFLSSLIYASISLQDNLLLDIYLSPHVDKLYSEIRKRALIQVDFEFMVVFIRYGISKPA